MTFCDHHRAFLLCNLTGVPGSDTPCRGCQHPKSNWFCLSCKDVFCCTSVKDHFIQHFKVTQHCLAVRCSVDKSVYCCSCEQHLHPQEIEQLWANCRSSSSKLKNFESMIVDVIDLLSRPFPSVDIHPQLDAQSSFVGLDKLALAKERLWKLIDRGINVLADPNVQEQFLLYSTTLLSAESCFSELKVTFSSFKRNVSEDIATFIKAQEELKAGSDLSASITQKELVASDKKVASFKAMIKELEAQIKRLEACLATEERIRAKIDEAIDSIETQVTTARDGLVSDLAQAANQLIAHQQYSAWDELKTS